MDRSVGPPPEPRGDKPTLRFRPSHALLLGLLVGLLVLGGLWASPHGGPLAPAPLLAPTAPGAHLAPAAVTHGDLNASGSVTIAPPSGHMTYYQGGNITVPVGGHLTIQNTTLSFVQFVGNNGTVPTRLDHIYSFIDGGQVTLVNSTITTDMNLLDPFPVLNLRISGSFQMTNSSLEFPGSVMVSGSGASFWAYHSRIAPNPDAGRLLNGSVAPDAGTYALYNATAYAPALWVQNGAHMALLASVETRTYRDNPTGSAPLGLRPDTALPPPSHWVLTSGGPTPLSGFAPAATDPESLALQTALPSIAAASLTLGYTQVGVAHSSGSTFAFGGSFPLPQINFTNPSGSVSVALPNGAIAAVNAAGLPSYLSAVAGGAKVVQLGATNGTSVTITSASLSYRETASYNITASGPGSIFTAADSVLDLNWNTTPGLQNGPTYAPWNSSKLLALNGAQAFLADDAVPYALPTNYAHQSIAIPMDNSSHVNVYRWLTVPVHGLNGLPVAGASVSAYYAYSGTQTNNGTVVSLNGFSAVDPDLAAYIPLWDASHGAPAYGATNPVSGNASLLLASGELDATRMPDGQFLGDYHVGVNPGSPTVGAVQWFYTSVTAYPHRMLANASNQAGSDHLSPAVFPNYQASLSVSGPTLSIAAAVNANHTIAIGQNISVNATVRSSGTGVVAGFTTTLFYKEAGSAPVKIGAQRSFPSLVPGASVNVAYNWTVNETIVGIHPPSVQGTFVLVANWTPGARTINGSTTVSVVPSYLSLTLNGLPKGTVQPAGTSIVTGRVGFSGSGSAYVNVTALSSTNRYQLGFYTYKAGNFSFELFLPSEIQPGTYTLTVSAAHYGRTIWQNYSGQFTIAAPPSSSSTPWYLQTFAGLALWIWLVIIAAIVVGLVLFLLFARQLAKGKFVECGECGNLIPEDATACPKCGAEFETESVRCSRCGATIPAASKFCPECAVTLLGRGVEERDDPERQGYADFVERFRVEARKELGENYAEGSFWDWWRRQSTYVSFTQWRLQQSQGSRLGMTAPRETPAAPPPPPKRPRTPPKPVVTGASPTAARPPPPVLPSIPEAPAEGQEAAEPSEGASAANGMKTCGTCQKEIPSDYLVCPFCGAVTQ